MSLHLIKFGFIGCGKISEFHADVIRALHHRIAGVSARRGSKNIKDFAERYGIANQYFDRNEMIEKEKPDALVVAVSWDQTERIIEDIIHSGIPCLVEKPVALSSSALQKIINNTEPFHNRVMVGYNRRFYDFIPVLKEALDEKELISIELNFPDTAERLIELKSQKIAKHILVYMTSHWIDLLLYLIGDVKVEWMTKKSNKQKTYFEAYNGILLSVRYNAPVHLQANFNASSNISITFNFRDSIYKLCPLEILTVYKGMTLIEPSHENPIRRYIPRIENTYNVDTAFKPGFYNQMKYFIDVYVKKTGQNTTGCTLHDALSVTRLCEEIEAF